METTTDKFARETELTAENCMKRVPEEALSKSLNHKSKLFKNMKRLCEEYIAEGKESSPEYGILAMDIAEVCTNWLLEIGEIK